MSIETRRRNRSAFLGPLQGWLTRTLSDPQLVILLLLVLAGLALLFFVGSVLAPIFASIIIAYLFERPAQWMERQGLTRTLIATALTTIFIAIIGLVLFVLVPILLAQVAQLARELPAMFNEVQRLMLSLPDLYPDVFDRRQVQEFAAGLNRDVVGIGQQLLLYSVSLLPTLATVGMYLFISPLLVFFFIKDRTTIVEWFVRFLPDHRPLADQVWAEISLKLGGYVRGRTYEMIIVGAVCFVTFVLLDLQFAVLLAVLAGASVLIPYFGAFMVGVPVFVTAYAQWGFGPELLSVMIAYTLIQTIDGTILVTLLLAGVVNLHPIAVMVAILIFGDIYGFWGVFFAVPLASVVQVILDSWPRRGLHDPQDHHDEAEDHAPPLGLVGRP